MGYLPSQGLLIAAGIKTINMNEESYNNNKTGPTLRAKYVTKAGKYDINYEANATFADETAYAFATDVYLDNTLSLGVTYKSQKEDLIYNLYSANDLDYFSIRAKKFFTPQISVEANANFGGEVDGFSLSAGYCF